MGAEPRVLAAGTAESFTIDQARAEDNFLRFVRLVQAGAFSGPRRRLRVGLEVEGNTFDLMGGPAPYGEEVVGPDGVHELLKSNWEANIPAAFLSGAPFTQMGRDLAARLVRMGVRAADRDCRVGMMGIAPTFGYEHATLEQMTPSGRYAELDRRFMALHDGRIRHLIYGDRDILNVWADSFLPEGLMTAVQLHRDVLPEEFADAYNGAQLALAACVAAFAGSPHLAGRRLWDETRIPFFETALPGRCGFGNRWVHDVYELFQSGLGLPAVILEEPNSLWMRNLRMRMGTWWLWNRPCLFPGPDDKHPDTNPTITIENRVRSSGPTPRDIAADAAFATGVMLHCQDLMAGGVAEWFDFSRARSNFYAAARRSTAATIEWPQVDGTTLELTGRDLVMHLLEPAAASLARRGVSSREIRTQLGVVEHRVRTHTAAAWLDQAVTVLGPQKATLLWLENSDRGDPIGTWDAVR